MYCKNCGAQLADNAAFCTECGTPQNAQQAQPQQPQYQQAQYQQPRYQQPQYQQPQYQHPFNPVELNSKPILVTGILSLVFAGLGLVGLILAIVSKSKYKAYVAAGGSPTGAAKAGRILSTLGLIFSIIAMVYVFIWIIVLIAGGIGSAVNINW